MSTQRLTPRLIHPFISLYLHLCLSPLLSLSVCLSLCVPLVSSPLLSAPFLWTSFPKMSQRASEPWKVAVIPLNPPVQSVLLPKASVHWQSTGLSPQGNLISAAGPAALNLCEGKMNGVQMGPRGPPLAPHRAVKPFPQPEIFTDLLFPLATF